MWLVIVVAIVVLCFIGGVVVLIGASLLVRRARNSRLTRFDSRESLSVTELCNACFPRVPPRIVGESLATISGITGIDVGKLRPADRFDVELKLLQGNYISGEWEEIEEAIAKQRYRVRRLASVRTIDDWVNLMGENPES